jgi:hypothetical protein
MWSDTASFKTIGKLSSSSCAAEAEYHAEELRRDRDEREDVEPSDYSWDDHDLDWESFDWDQD